MAASQNQNTNSLRTVAEEYAKIRLEREALDAKVKELKEKEDEAKAALVTEMNASGMPSVRLDSLGRFVIKTSIRYDITDIDLLVRAMLRRMVDNGQAGRPLSDGLLLQKRPAKGIIEELIEADYFKRDNLQGLGLVQVENLDLTFTKQK